MTVRLIGTKVHPRGSEKIGIIIDVDAYNQTALVLWSTDDRAEAELLGDLTLEVPTGRYSSRRGG